MTMLAAKIKELKMSKHKKNVPLFLFLEMYLYLSVSFHFHAKGLLDQYLE